MVTSFVIHRPGLWKKLIGSIHYLLLIDGQEYARITTHLRNKSEFAEAASVRRTTVNIGNNPQWLIEALEPGPRETRTTVFGNTREKLHPIGSRIITVSENGQPIANSDGRMPKSSTGSFVAVADGVRFTLSPRQSQSLVVDFAARVEDPEQETIDGVATFRRGYSAWSLNASSPIPLSIALLLWHVLLGDWTAPKNTIY
jgi:hypothetical protein